MSAPRTSPAWRQRFGVWLNAGPVIGLGCLALMGWAFDVPALTGLLPGQATMKANTAVALVLAGAGLLELARVVPRRWPVGVPAALVVAVALATLFEYGTGRDLGVDEWLVRDPATARALHPGRMALATAVALLSAGVALLLAALAVRHRVVRAAWQILVGALLTIGGLGVLGYLLNVAVLHTWYPFSSVALPTAVAFTLLGCGLLVAGRRVWPAEPLTEDQRITHAAAFALAFVAGITAVAGMAALEWQTRRSTETGLSSLLDVHVAEITSNLELRTSRAAIVTTRPNLLVHWRKLVREPDDAAARAVVTDVLVSFLSHDFVRLSITLPSGEEVARAGEAPTAASVAAVPLTPFGNARLVWRDGAVALSHALTVRDGEGPLGTVTAEQRVPRVTDLLLRNQTQFTSSEFLLCSPPAEAMFRCFPSRLSGAPVVVPAGPRDAPRLAERALAEGAGVSTAVDYRSHRVIGAYASLPQLGLLAVLKVDADELYAPVRYQLGLALLLALAVSAGGMALIRLRVGPLAARLEERVRQRTADLQRAGERLALLHEIDRGLIAARTPEEIAEATLGTLRDLLGTSRVIVNLFDLEAGEVEWLAAIGRRRLRLGPGVRYSLELAGDLDALRRGEPQVIGLDSLPPGPDVDALRASGVLVYMVVPMIVGGELIGSVSFGGATGDFPPEQVGIAQDVAAQMAIAIHQARLRGQVISQARELERRVQERTSELSTANARLEREVAERRRAEADAEQANRTKSQFVANMSHEVRTPLNAILGFAELMHDGKAGPVSATHKEFLGDILTSGRHLLQLINDVLDLAKVESGRMEFRPEPVDPHGVMHEIREIVRPLAGRKRIRLDTSVDPALGPLVLDPAKLKQVLYNYVSNAIKFTPEEGRVSIRAIADGPVSVRFEVEDTGVGIREEDLPRLFTEFEQLEPTRADRPPGTGLGLAVTKRLVEAQGGTVGVRSTVGRGAVFFAILPRAFPLPT